MYKRASQKFRKRGESSGTPSGRDDFINIETRHLCWKLVIRRKRRRRVTIRSSFSSLGRAIFFLFLRPCFFFQFRRRTAFVEPRSVYYDEFNRSPSLSLRLSAWKTRATSHGRTVIRRGNSRGETLQLFVIFIQRC